MWIVSWAQIHWYKKKSLTPGKGGGGTPSSRKSQRDIGNTACADLFKKWWMERKPRKMWGSLWPDVTWGFYWHLPSARFHHGSIPGHNIPDGSALWPSRLGIVRAEAAAKGQAISPWGQRQWAQTGRQGLGLLRVPLGWENEPKPPTQTSVLPNVGSLPTSLRTDLVGSGREFCSHQSPWLPQTEPCDSIWSILWRGFLNGTGWAWGQEWTQPDEITVSLL